MGRMFTDLLAETTLEPQGHDTTLVQQKAHLDPRGVNMYLMHSLFMQCRLRKRRSLHLRASNRSLGVGE